MTKESFKIEELNICIPQSYSRYSKIDENEDSEVVEFIDKYITYALPDETRYLQMSNLVKKVQAHHHTTTCRTKKDVACKFNAPWTQLDKTKMVCSEEKIDETIAKQSKNTFLYYHSK